MIIIDQITFDKPTGLVTSFSIQHNVSSADAVLLVTISNSKTTIPPVTFGGMPLTNLVSLDDGTVLSSIWVLWNPPVGTRTLTITNAIGSSNIVTAMTLLGVDKRTQNPVTATATGSTATASLSITPASPNSLIIDCVMNDSTGSPGTLVVSSPQTQINNQNDGGSPANAVGTSFLYSNQSTQNLSWTLTNQGSWTYTAVALEPADAPSIWHYNLNLRNQRDTIQNNGLDTQGTLGTANRGIVGYHPSTFNLNSFLHTVGRILPPNPPPNPAGNVPNSSNIVIDSVSEATAAATSLTLTGNINSPDSVVAILVGDSGGGATETVTFNGNNVPLLTTISDTLTDSANAFVYFTPSVGPYTVVISNANTSQMTATVVVLLGVDKKDQNIAFASSNATGVVGLTTSINVTAPNTLLLNVVFNGSTSFILSPGADQTQVTNQLDGFQNNIGVSFKLASPGTQTISWSSTGGSDDFGIIILAFIPNSSASIWNPNIRFRNILDVVNVNNLNNSDPALPVYFGRFPSTFYLNSFLHTVGRINASTLPSVYGILSSSNVQSNIIIDQVIISNSGGAVSSVDITIPSQDASLLVFIKNTGATTNGLLFDGTPMTNLTSAGFSYTSLGITANMYAFYLSNPPVGNYPLQTRGTAPDSISAIVLLGVDKTNPLPSIFTLAYNSPNAPNKSALPIYPQFANSLAIDFFSQRNAAGNRMGVGQTLIADDSAADASSVLSYAIVSPGENTMSWSATGANPPFGAGSGHIAVILNPAKATSISFPSIRTRNIQDVITTGVYDSPLSSTRQLLIDGYKSAVFHLNSFLHTVGREFIPPTVIVSSPSAESEYPTSQIIVDKVYQGQVASQVASTVTLTMDVNIPSQEAVLVVTGGTVITTGAPFAAVQFNGVSLTQQVQAAVSGADAEIWTMFNPPTGTYQLTVVSGTGGEIYANAMVLLGVDKTNPNVVTASITDSASTSTITNPITPDVDNALVIDCLSTLNATQAPVADRSQTQVFNATALVNNEYVISTYELSSFATQNTNYNLGVAVNAALVSIALRPAHAPSMWFPNIDLRTIDDTVTASDLDAGSNPAFGQYGYKPTTFYQNSFLHTIGRQFAIIPGVVIPSVSSWMTEIEEPYPDQWGVVPY